MHEGKSHSSTMSCVVWNCLFTVKRHEKYIKRKRKFCILHSFTHLNSEKNMLHLKCTIIKFFSLWMFYPYVVFTLVSNGVSWLDLTNGL